MRIKIIGDNNCARATRHLLRLAGFAVTEFLPAEAAAQGPHAGYAITIEIAHGDFGEALAQSPPRADEGQATKNSPEELAPATRKTPDTRLRPDPSASVPQTGAAADKLAPHAEQTAGGLPAMAPNWGAKACASVEEEARIPLRGTRASSPASAVGPAAARIHFDSVESPLETAVLRHVAQLAAAPVLLHRPGGLVHSERELRIVIHQSSDAHADEAAAVAVEFGVLRGLLDLVAPKVSDRGANLFARAWRTLGTRKKWWPLAILLPAIFWSAAATPAPPRAVLPRANGALRAPLAVRAARIHSRKPTPLLRVALPAAEPQGQFATGQGLKITDGANFLAIDPCKAQAKSYLSISQTANTQLAAGTASKKIYICSIHVVVAAATSVALVEGTGTVCGTNTAGVSGFGGATAATGWNFAANGGIAFGNGDSSLGAEGTSGDNLCLLNSGSGQVSGGLSYVVQ